MSWQALSLVAARGRHTAAILLTLLVSVGANGAASAQNRGIVFGDSLSDNGNYYAITGFPPSPPYYKGNASNGLIWPEFLFVSLNSPVQGTGVAGNVDMAFFGARSDAIDNPALYPTHLPGARGLPLQISDFFAAGGRICSTDTVVVWAGANNIRECIDGPTTCNTRSALRNNARSAAGSQVDAVKILVKHGARTVLVPNTPSIGPSTYWTTAADKNAGNASAAAFNATLFQKLKRLAATAPAGTNLIYADANAVQQTILANPTAFGFSNTTASCLGGTTVCANPNLYYYWDFLHWSEAAQAYYALYFSLLLDTAPALLDLAPLGETLYATGSLVTNAVYDRLTNWFSGTYAYKNGPYIELLGQLNRIDSKGGRPAYDSDIGGIRFGLDKQLENGLIGGSVALLKGPLDSGNLSADTDAVRADLYATFSHGIFYASGDFGFGNTWFSDVERNTGFGPVIANSDTDGYYLTASTEVGAAQSVAGFVLIPSARVTYAHADLDGYQEQATLLALRFGDQTSDAWLGRANLRVMKNLSLSNMPLSLFAEVGYEGYLSFSGNEITAVLVNNTALPTSVAPADPTVPGFYTKAGLSAQVASNLYLDINYGVSFADGNGESHSGTARLKAHF